MSFLCRILLNFDAVTLISFRVQSLDLGYFMIVLIVGLVDHFLSEEIELVKGENTLRLICILNILNQFFWSILIYLIILLIFNLSVLLSFFLVLHLYEILLLIWRCLYPACYSWTEMSSICWVSTSSAQRREI